jgi:hypothetical protein
VKNLRTLSVKTVTHLKYVKNTSHNSKERPIGQDLRIFSTQRCIGLSTL